MVSLKISVLGIGFLTIISLISLIFILTKVDPYNASPNYFIWFYLSLFIVLLGLFTLAGFCLRKLFIKNKIPARLLKVSLRQGILISIILTGFLLLWTLIK